MRGKLWELLDNQSSVNMDASMAAGFVKSAEVTQNDRTGLLRLAADGDENARGAYLDSLMPVILSKMKPYADVIGYPTAVMKAVAGNAEEYLDSVQWNLDESAEHDLVRRVQYNTIDECFRYRTAHAVELLSLKLDDKSRSEYLEVRDQLKSFDEERLADAWLCMSDRDRQIICMRFGAGGERKSLEEVASALQIPRERVRQIQHMFLDRLCRGCAIPKKVLSNQG